MRIWVELEESEPYDGVEMREQWVLLLSAL